MLGLLGVGLGCTSPAVPKKACFVLSSSDTLNLYDGRPHQVTVYIYPLSSTDGFRQANVDDLLSGALPSGVLTPPIPITVSPGELKRSFQDLFPPETTHLGIVADYYRAPRDREGMRSEVVPARCGIRKPKINLATTDIIAK